jgi:hypothetical protein
MYPHNYFQLFPAFPREDKVFVAMSFTPSFENRWKNVIDPAIRNVEVHGLRQEPYRVDTRQVSDSILTEILTGISRSRVVFADITTIGYLNQKPVRNGNVMYEVGIAHTIRLPEEVILFRSDQDDLLFDVANVRVNSYDPDTDPKKAKMLVENAIVEAIKEVDLKKHLSVKAAAESLDFPSWVVLIDAALPDGIKPPVTKTMGDVMATFSRIPAISKLLEMGALTTRYLKMTPGILSTHAGEESEFMLRYKITPFGSALLEHITSRMGMDSSEMLKAIEAFLAKNSTT